MWKTKKAANKRKETKALSNYVALEVDGGWVLRPTQANKVPAASSERRQAAQAEKPAEGAKTQVGLAAAPSCLRKVSTSYGQSFQR